MKSYEYLIAGGGMAAAAAVKGIRELDPDGSIAVVCEEPDPPYDRPPLSKSLWKGKPLDAVWMDTAGAELALGRTVAALRPASHSLLRDDGEEIGYGKLLIATGGSPRRLGFAGGAIIYLRNLGDYRELRRRCETADRFLVVGGGLVASEIAAALAMNRKKATMLFPGEGIDGRLLPREFSLRLNDFYRSKGIELFPGESLASLEARGGEYIAGTSSGREMRPRPSSPAWVSSPSWTSPPRRASE